MPQALPTSSDLYADWHRRLPSWVFRNLSRYPKNVGAIPFDGITFDEYVFEEDYLADEVTNKDPIYGTVSDRFEEYYQWLAKLLQETRILDAHGDWLELHALDRGLYRRHQESDDALRVRIRNFPEVATERAIFAAVYDVMKPGLPSGYSRCYWDGTFYASTRVAPDLSIDVFTLRYRFMAWTDGVLANNRLRAWGRGGLWGCNTFPDTLAQPKKSWFWRIGFWGAGTWTNANQLRGERELVNPFAVAVVVVPPQLLYVRTFWNSGRWSLSFWGGVAPNLPRYRAIREAVEQVRAAGVEVQIWIKG
ncbi:hypothetical protein IT570_03505 [Candidatus Sumerlaeota bacterium]|nr:hypothetical protein [Candidatus Sumerlaeota bacterium]